MPPVVRADDTAEQAAAAQRDRAAGRSVTGPDVVSLIAEVDDVGLRRVVLSLAAMHEPTEQGRCRWCHRRARWWRRRRPGYCRTHQVLAAELRSAAAPRWVSA